MYRGPSEKPPARKIPSEMPAKIICDPPLGQATVLSPETEDIHFTALLQCDASKKDKAWEVALWHDLKSPDDWDIVPFEEAPGQATTFSISKNSNGKAYEKCFTARLSGWPATPRPLRFTLKYRPDPAEDWHWVNHESSLKDGELYFQTKTPQPDDLGFYLHGKDAAVVVRPEFSECPNTTLWSLSAPVGPAKGPSSGIETLSLGLPNDFGRWMALVRYWSPWLSPEQGRSKFAPIKDAVLCSFLRFDGRHLVLLAVSGIDGVLTVLRSDEQGNIMCASRNDDSEPGTSRVIVSVGDDYESAVAAVMYHARTVVRQAELISGEAEAEAKALVEGVRPEWMQNWYEGLAYCTWNGLGQQLSEAKILEALASLQESGVHITNLIIDDNWQALDPPGANQFRQGWVEFEANKEGFPNGLKSTITKIRNEHKHIQHIAVWHALLGYWGGIAPEGKLSKTYQTVDVRMKQGIRPPGGRMHVIAEPDVKRFYEDFYGFLSDAGIDSVKTDAQFFIDQLEDADDRQKLIKTYQDAWTISSLRWFSIKAISCMSQTPQILFHSQLPTNRPRILVRNSDDFFPLIPASHPWHIFTNAHNSLLTQHLNLLPDWDMFQTSHPWASFHAAARCVSGGPVYITDEPKQHDIDLIRQMTAVTPRGETVIMRPGVGRTTQQYVGYDEERLVKIGTYTGMQRTGSGILGLFNIGQNPLTEFIRLADFPGVLPRAQYVVRAHTSGRISCPLDLESALPAALMTVVLPTTGWEILTSHPLSTHTLSRRAASDASFTLSTAPLGLLSKMTGAAALLPSSFTRLENSHRLHISVRMKVLGVLGIYISCLSELSIKDNLLIMMEGKVVPEEVVNTDGQVLKLDTAKAWKDMGLDGGWSNEVGVELFIT